MIRQSKVSLSILFILFLVALFAPSLESLLEQDYHTQNLTIRFAKPVSTTFLENGNKATHWLGTDELGRDVLIRLIYGARVSLAIALTATFISGLLGLIVGVISGYCGGWIDALLMRITDSLLAIPLIPVLIFVAALDFSKFPMFFGITSPTFFGFAKVIIILCLFSWMSVARLIRTMVLNLKKREYIMAARALGATPVRIILQHILPQIATPLFVSLSIGVGEAILFESALSFLGMGIQPPSPSWGSMLSNAQELVYHAPLLAIAPGLLILVTVISFNSLAASLRDFWNPHQGLNEIKSKH
ncbi:MAG: hypothetical protein RJB66_1826 [Pseudomonadota bacterium]|jgi:peptide/nickel transport system permease protein